MKCQCEDYRRERIEQGTAPRDLCRMWCELRKWIPDGDPNCEFQWTTK